MMGRVSPPQSPPHTAPVATAPGYAFVITGVALFSLNAGTSAVVLDGGVSPVALTAVRLVGTAVILGAALLLSGRVATLAVPRRQWPAIVAYGAGGVALVQLAYFVAIDRLPIGLALLLEYTAPLIVALVARFALRQQVSRLVWPALALTMLGLVLATRVEAGDRLDPVGVIAALVAALAFATYFLLGERLVRDRDPLSTTFWGFAVAAVATLVLASPSLLQAVRAVGSRTDLPPALGGGEVATGWLLLTVILFGTLAPFAAATAALRYLPATVVTVIATGEVVGAALVAWWWFGESLRLVQVAGFALVMAGVVLALLSRAGLGRPGRPDRAAS